MPACTSMAAWTFLERTPFAVLSVFGLVCAVAVLLGGTAWVPLALAVAAITAVLLPAFDDWALSLFARIHRRDFRS